MEVARVRRFVVLAVVIAALSATGTAWGKCRPGHGGPGAVKEYTEPIPTVCGPKTPGTGGGTTPLPPAVDRALGHGSEAEILRKLSTDGNLGAPHGKRHTADSKSLEKPGRNPLSVAGSVVTDGSDGRLIALLAIMGAIALVAGYAAYRRRFDRR
jgi:hypothetical protein